MPSVTTIVKKLIPRKMGYWMRRVKLDVRKLLYRGKNFHCPLCDRSYSTFFEGGFDLPVIEKLQIIGAGKRKHAICPGCASNDRDRLLHFVLTNNKLGLLPAYAILHIAPEPALADWLSEFQRKNKSDYIKGVKYHEGFFYGNDIELIDLLSLKYSDEQFDLLICNHVLEHISEDRVAMKEIFRVLKPGGNAILQVPWSPLLDVTFEDETKQSPAEREEFFGQFDHVRVYGKDYPDRLRSVGFDLRILTTKTLEISDQLISKHGLNAKEVVFIASKPKNSL